MEMQFDSQPTAEAGIALGAASSPEEAPELAPGQIVDLMLSVMSDGLDHPELWASRRRIVANVAVDM